MKIFGEHPDLVMSLLNALLPLEEGKQIESVEYVKPWYTFPENPGKKTSIVFVKCKDTSREELFVEIQINLNNEFQYRMELSREKVVVKQLGKGDDNTLAQPIYLLDFINDTGFASAQDDFYHDYAIVNVAHTDRINEGLRFVFVELPKFFTSKQQGLNMPPPFALKKMAVLWLRFLTEIDKTTEEAQAELLDNPETCKALKILEKSAYTEKQLLAYEQFWDAVINERVAVEGGFKKGRAEGLAEGRAEGALNASLDNARRMKADAMPVELIAKYTGLTPDQIEQL